MQEVFLELSEVFLKNSVSEKTDAKRNIVLPEITKQYNIRKPSATKKSPIQGSLKDSDGFVYQKILVKRKKVKRKMNVGDFVKTADIKKTFSKVYTIIWSKKWHKITKSKIDAIRSCGIYTLPDRFSEAFPKKIKVNYEKR